MRVRMAAGFYVRAGQSAFARNNAQRRQVPARAGQLFQGAVQLIRTRGHNRPLSRRVARRGQKSRDTNLFIDTPDPGAALTQHSLTARPRSSQHAGWW